MTCIRGFFLMILAFSLQFCEQKSDQLFSELSEESGIVFNNSLEYTEDFNPYTYRNFYNGAGVALGDINNDGLLDVYLTGNLVGNKLFLNKGGWEFEDITELAGVGCPNVWSSGATFVDLNSDGLLDLYVCKSGKPGGDNRHNELFINNGNNTFIEEASKYNLDITGLSTHAAFFDYDKDGDLDVYILTNSIRSIGLGFDLAKGQRNIPDPNKAGNKFLVNEGGVYVDRTLEAGIFSSNIGFGLGITLGDFNGDGWTDVFISNDFFERDYLYINDTKGAFSEEAEKYFKSLSMGSMGADVGDLNNDGSSEIFVTEMLPRGIERVRSKTMFETWDKYQVGVSNGYFHQFSRNVLQRNLGNDQFAELGRFSDVAATEWSWGALISDLDNDGLNDILVSNGIYKDLLDRDYLTYMANEERIKQKIKGDKENVISDLIDAIPSSPVSNAVFKNIDGFRFDDVASDWGLAEPSFSNGSAFGDLDNDGDLDLVINNVNMKSFVYRNNLDTSTNRSVMIKLIGVNNTTGIGAKIEAWVGDESWISFNHPSRGFQSSVDHRVHIGVGHHKKLDSVRVTWAEGGQNVLRDVSTNQLVTFKEVNKADGVFTTDRTPPVRSWKKLDLDYSHQENPFVDFDRERLLFQMYSNSGPPIAAGDVDADGKIEFFFGGAKGNHGEIYELSNSGFNVLTRPAQDFNDASEDVSAEFFDCDNDGDLDLYIGSGGRAFSKVSNLLADRLYLNDGSGNFLLDKNRLPLGATFSSSSVDVGDFDGDGDLDLFVGERFHPSYYAHGGAGHIFRNDGKGYFSDVTNSIANGLGAAGMITDGKWLDVEGDGDLDLITVGDWMGVRVWQNANATFTEITDEAGLSKSRGWWNVLETVDVDLDGDLDLVAGNHGANTFFEKGTRMYYSDFDGNGSAEHVICHLVDGKYYPIADRDELVAQMPGLKKKLLYFKDYAKMSVDMIFSDSILSQSRIFEVDITETSIFYNDDGVFNSGQLPSEVQYTPIYALASADINRDGFPDLVLGGNQYRVKPQFGRFDALSGLVIFGSEYGFTSDNIKFLDVDGEVRDIEVVEEEDRLVIVFTVNNGVSQAYEIEF